YIAPCPRVAFQANARVCACECVASAATAIDVATARRRAARLGAPTLRGRLKVIEAPLDAARERGVEIGAVAEVANQVGDGDAARLLQHAADGQGAGGVGELRLVAGKLTERSSQQAERHRPRQADAFLRPVEIAGFERR